MTKVKFFDSPASNICYGYTSRFWEGLLEIRTNASWRQKGFSRGDPSLDRAQLHRKKRAKPPKTLLKSINKLKKLDDIVINKPDKGSGVFVMNKSIMFICFVKHQSTTQPNSHQSDWRDPQREEDLQSTTTHCSRKKSTLNRLSEESFPMK